MADSLDTKTTAEQETREEEPGVDRWLRVAALAGLFVVVFLAGGLAALVVVLSILFIVFMHELGHYLTARWGGMKATEFFLGFGPRIWSFKRGETEYGLKAIPAGAYVKVIGMNNLDEVDPIDEPRTYRQASFPRRLAVAVAGSGMHFLMAFALLVSLFSGFGFDGFITDQEELDELQAAATASADWSIGSVSEDSLAEQVGLEPGDKVTVINGTPIESFDDLTEQIRALDPGTTVTFEYLRSDGTFAGSGELTEHPNFPGRGLLGVGPAALPPDRVGIISGIGKSVEEFGDLTVQSVTQLADFFTPSSLGNFFSSVVDTEPDEPVAGEVGTNEEAGEDEGRILSIYGAARAGTAFTENGVSSLFQFLVLINIFIGVFNLVPLLPLDGGHVVLAVYERIRSIGGQRYHADVSKALPIVYAVVFILLSVGLAALYLDITDPII